MHGKLLEWKTSESFKQSSGEYANNWKDYSLTQLATFKKGLT